MDRKEIKEAAALFNTVKTIVEEVETPVSFLNEAEEVITVELDKMPRDKKGLEEWEKAAPIKIYEAVNAIESVRIGDDIRTIDDAMLAEYLPELVKALYMEVKATMVPKEEEKPEKGKKLKKEKAEKDEEEKPAKTSGRKAKAPSEGTKREKIISLVKGGNMTKKEVIDSVQEAFPGTSRAATASYISHATNPKYSSSLGGLVTVDKETGIVRFSS